MYCLRWWLPIFLLPFPAAPPLFLLLFIISYALQTRPWYVCTWHSPADLDSIYCGVIIAGLFTTSCYWYLPTKPVDWSVTSLAKGYPRVQSYLLRAAAWVNNNRKDAPAPLEVAPNSSCAACWVDLAWDSERTLLDPMPRKPACEERATHAPTAGDAPMDRGGYLLRLPGTQLGVQLDFSL